MLPIALLLFASLIIAATVSAAYTLTFLDQIVHGELYHYGLQFSLNWANRYWAILRIIEILLVLVAVLTLFNALFVYRKYVYRKRLGGLAVNKRLEVELTRAQVKGIQQLESEKEALRLKTGKRKRQPPEMIAYMFLVLGATALISSIFFNLSILAFIGLGLSFWGALFLFLRPVRYVKSNLLYSTAISSLEAIDRVIVDLNYEGKAIYLPPSPYFLKGYKSGKVYISSNKNTILPPSEELASEKVFLKNPQGICLIPPGLGLANLYEKELGTEFLKVDLEYLESKLPSLFTDDLEIASNFEMNIQNDTVHIKITGSVFNELCKEVRNLLSFCNSLGCPLCGSIACALSRAIGKPIVIEKTQLSQDANMIEAYYRVIEG